LRALGATHAAATRSDATLGVGSISWRIASSDARSSYWLPRGRPRRLAVVGGFVKVRAIRITPRRGSHGLRGLGGRALPPAPRQAHARPPQRLSAPRALVADPLRSRVSRR